MMVLCACALALVLASSASWRMGSCKFGRLCAHMEGLAEAQVRHASWLDEHFKLRKLLPNQTCNPPGGGAMSGTAMERAGRPF